MFSIRKKKSFFNTEEKQQIVEAIQQAEKKTSGEIRVFVESKCRYMNALDRATEIFAKEKMYATVDRNAVLLYVAIKDRQLAIFGDEGIHSRVGDEYWSEAVKNMISHFNKENFVQGIRECVLEVGEALVKHFPYNKDSDKNELPDDIMFGR
jgi:uncharacterized membrane protein